MCAYFIIPDFFSYAFIYLFIYLVLGPIDIFSDVLLLKICISSCWGEEYFSFQKPKHGCNTVIAELRYLCIKGNYKYVFYSVHFYFIRFEINGRATKNINFHIFFLPYYTFMKLQIASSEPEQIF